MGCPVGAFPERGPCHAFLLRQCLHCHHLPAHPVRASPGKGPHLASLHRHAYTTSGRCLPLTPVGASPGKGPTTPPYIGTPTPPTVPSSRRHLLVHFLLCALHCLPPSARPSWLWASLTGRTYWPLSREGPLPRPPPSARLRYIRMSCISAPSCCISLEGACHT